MVELKEISSSGSEKKGKNDEMEQFGRWGQLPLELVREVVSRLPVKSIARFECVSRMWQGWISEPNFRLSVAPPVRERVLMVLESSSRSTPVKYKMLFYSLGSGFSVERLPIPREPVLSSTLDFFGTCNGLILVFANEKMFLWNPYTGACRLMPHLYDVANAFQIPDVSASGVCFDKVSNEYKAVIVVCDSEGPEIDCVLVYRLRGGERRYCTDFPYLFRLDPPIRDRGVVVSGHLHWIMRRQDDNHSPVIIYFDEEVDQFGELPMPPLISGDGSSLGITVLQGCLCIYQSGVGEDSFDDDDDHTYVFIMNEYGVPESWSVLFTLRGGFKPIASYVSSRLVLVSRSGDSFFTYHLDTNSLVEIDWAPLDLLLVKEKGPDDDEEEIPVDLPLHYSCPFAFVESLTSVDFI
ncbi:OLC1v1019821C1 [Oldenlandia corymbosa var. corymbosa]|uniref:OLC1v1019821C1 n=1 Tax=Oldenlandia corymbosa var. corymbosa TaxID=529605 RepID=A0AAV1EF02_OLDCO|nr:OLC1v1019821C1 [Oldenlandia corymbosa var. corymbosa]